ncbi:unnamed protein product [Closterium sp. Naga37s-1]|nr:unnamed protein product [Closterium sp. Naga37s-1]
MASLDSIPGHLSDTAAQAGGKAILVQFVIYDLPGRDCKAWSSNEEIPKGGFDTYKTKYINVAMACLQKKAANVRLSLVIEPDSLPNIATNMGTNRCDATTDKEYTEGVAHAIAELSQIPDTTLYLDSGFRGWLGWPEGMKRVVAVYKKILARARQIRTNTKIRGFASNVANYSPLFASGCPTLGKCPLAKNLSTGEMCYDWNPCIDENRFTARMNAYLAAAELPTRWIVDTSRSGRAGIRNRWGSWCNVKGTGIGQRPEADPANAPQVDALVWIKPPGESDGHSTKFLGIFPVDRECNLDDALGLDALPSAPRAGQWFQTQFTALVRYANPPMPAGKVDPPTPTDPCMTDPKTNPACDPFWEDLAVKYSPQYKFHPDETIWPITIDEYLTHVYDSMGSYFVGDTEHQNFVNSLAGDYNHITDLVAIEIRFSKTGQPQRIWYAQHGGSPMWAWDTGADWADPKPKEFATVMGTHPIVPLVPPLLPASPSVLICPPPPLPSAAGSSAAPARAAPARAAPARAAPARTAPTRAAPSRAAPARAATTHAATTLAAPPSSPAAAPRSTPTHPHVHLAQLMARVGMGGAGSRGENRRRGTE